MGNPKGFINSAQLTISYVPEKERLKNFKEFYLPLSPEQRQEQAGRCMDCAVPFCHSSYGCPVDNLIPEWNHLLYEGRWKDAFLRLRKTNNFPEFTGRVCPAPCQTSCVLGINADPVTIKDNEVDIINHAYAKGWVVPQIPKFRNGMRVAIVGSGPAGLAAADQLNQLGYTVTVYERDDRIGGLLMYGIPNMKLDKSLVEKRVDIMRQESVSFITGVEVGKDIDIQELKAKNDALLLCIGSTNPRDISIPGRKLKGIHFAMDFLRPNTRSLLDSNLTDGAYIDAKGKHVIVIGGGDTGNDCIGTSLRHGCASLKNFELLSKPPLSRSSEHPWPLYPRVLKHDYGHSEALSCFGKDPREFSILSKEFISDDGQHVSGIRTVRVKWERTASEQSPKANPIGPPKMVEIPNTEEIYKADFVLLALGFLGPEQILIENLSLKQDNRGNIEASPKDYRTNIQDVFVAGDARRGQSLVVWAIHEGREAAAAIHEHLREQQSTKVANAQLAQAV